MENLGKYLMYLIVGCMVVAFMIGLAASKCNAGAYGGVFNHARPYGGHRGYGYARKHGPTHAHPTRRDMRRPR